MAKNKYKNKKKNQSKPVQTEPAIETKEEVEEEKPKYTTTLDDIDDAPPEPEISEEERIKQILERNKDDTECTLDKKKDEKLKNIMTYSCIPFILVSIGFSLFNIGRVRYPLSFLFLSIGLGIIAVFYYLRHKNLQLCKCKLCETQAKSTLQFAIIFGIITLCLIGAFIYFSVVAFR